MCVKESKLIIRFVPPSKEYIECITVWKKSLRQKYCCPYCGGDIDIHVQPASEGLKIEPNLVFLWRCPVAGCVWCTNDNLEDWWCFQTPLERISHEVPERT